MPTLNEAVAGARPGRRQPKDRDLQAIVLDLQRGPFADAGHLIGDGRDEGVARPADRRAARRTSAESRVRGTRRHPSSAALDIARTRLRRAERRLVAARDGGMSMSAALIAYVNRASDLAYVLARRGAGDGDEPLSPSERVRVLSAARPSGSRLACPEMTNRRRSDREQLGSDGDLKPRLPEILSWTAVARDRARPRGG